MTGDEDTLGGLAARQLEALAGAAGFESDRARLLAMLGRTSASWSGRRLDELVRWSGISDDCSPIEYSVVIGGARPELRILVEPQRDPASPASYYRATCELVEELARDFGADLSLFRRVEEIFDPTREVYFSAFLGIVFWPGSAPLFKLYLNPAAHGIAKSHQTMEAALASLGLFGAWKRIAPELSRDDEPQFLCVDLSAQEGSRVKAYFRHQGATIDRLERIAALADEHVPGDLRAFCTTLLGDSAFPRPPLTMLSLREGSTRPQQAALHVPLFPFVSPDATVHARVLALKDRFDLPATAFEAYEKCVAALADGPLAEERGIHNYVSFQRRSGAPRVTAYLSSRMYLERLGRIGANPDVVWPSPEPRSSESSTSQSSVSGGHELARLVAPMEPEVFARDWFAKKPLFIRGTPDKLSSWFDRARFDRAIEHAAHLGATFSSRHALEVRPTDVPELYRAGATVCATEIDRGDPELARLALAIKTQLGHAGRVGVRAYLSPDGAGFDTHFDSVVATVIQLEGRKRWRFSESPAVVHPRFNANRTEKGTIEYVRPSGASERPWEKIAAPDESTFSEIVLEPGDVLCLPPGTWHNARAIGHSLALNLSFWPVSFWDLFSAAVEPLLQTREAWRVSPPPALASRPSDGSPPLEVTEHFAARIAELRELLDHPEPLALALSHAWRRAMLASEAIDRPRASGDVDPNQLLEVAKSAPIRFGFGPTSRGETALYVGFAPTGAELVFPVEILPFFQTLAVTDRFVASSAATWTGDGSEHAWPNVKRVLERLLQQGIITRA